MKRLHQKNPTPAMASSSFFLLHDRQSEKRHLFFCLIKRHSFSKSEKPIRIQKVGTLKGYFVAALFPSILAIHGEDELLDKLEGVYTFGQPRVGDEEFGEYMKEVMKKHGIEYERFVYNNDMVTRVPFDDKILFGYKHYGSCNYFNSLYKGK
ncbi:BnaCnng78080D, partial [Brassica napus]